MDKLVGGAALVLGHVLQVDGLLQEDLPLDAGPVVPLNSVDHLDREGTQRAVRNWGGTQLGSLL